MCIRDRRSTCLRGMLSLVNGLQTLKESAMTNLRQTWRVHWLSQSKTNGQYHALAAPSPRDWHGGLFPTHGELARGLSLTMRPTRRASPLCLFTPHWPETWLSPGSCANILGRFEASFQNSARNTIAGVFPEAIEIRDFSVKGYKKTKTLHLWLESLTGYHCSKYFPFSTFSQPIIMDFFLTYWVSRLDDTSNGRVHWRTSTSW